MRVGDEVRRLATGDWGVVVGVQEQGYCQVKFGVTKALVNGDELELLPQGPVEQLVQGDFGHVEPFSLRLQALYLKHAYRYDPASGLTNARIEPQLHQIYLAHQVTHKLQPRMILADEVGLGKTIEAGLIIKELRARQMIERVLIVSPASLQLQWQSELQSKFNEPFEVMDGNGLKFFAKKGDNPWLHFNNVICSLSLAALPKHAERISEVNWDLVVFDEAHRVRRSLQGKKVSSTQAYRLADELKESVNGLLLLTATSMQLHPFELFSLIELVEPGMFQDFSSYEAGRKQVPKLIDLMKSLRKWDALSSVDQTRALQKHERLLRRLEISKANSQVLLSDESIRAQVIDGLVRQHPLTGSLIRNRKAEIGIFSERHANTLLVDLAADERELYEDVTNYIRDSYNGAKQRKHHTVGFVMVNYQKMLASSSQAIRESFGRRLTKLRTQKAYMSHKPPKVSSHTVEELRDAPEASVAVGELEGAFLEYDSLGAEIRLLEDLHTRLGKVRDSKAGKLLEILEPLFSKDPSEKAIIFTQFIETQAFLAGVLKHNGLRIDAFNGQMSLMDKEEAVRSFRDRGQILIATEAGGEGRNFQFCHVMVNYDLPWNPMKVEQRIGRLDRIGQRRPVIIWNLACHDTIEERVLGVLRDRIRLFEESVGSLDPILGEVEKDIENIVMRRLSTVDDIFGKYEVELEQRVQEAREKEKTLADFVLDRASFRRDEAAELLGHSQMARWRDLQAFIARALRYYGGTLKDHSRGGEVISLSPDLARKLRLNPVIRGTFDPKRACAEEEIDFFAFGHEAIDRLLEVAIHTDSTQTTLRRADDVPPGVWVEIFYELRSHGVKPSGKFVRHLVNEQMEIRSETLTAVPSEGQAVQGIEAQAWLPDAVRVSEKILQCEQSREREVIETQNEDIKKQELSRAKRVADYRRVRLDKLVGDQETWIAEKDICGTEKEKRVLPARRGQLGKNRERLEKLEVELEAQLDKIGARQAGVDAQVLTAGVVVGP